MKSIDQESQDKSPTHLVGIIGRLPESAGPEPRYAEAIVVSEYPAGGSGRGLGQPVTTESDPIKSFHSWLGNATERELEEAERSSEERVLGCNRSASEWRLAMGQYLYEHRELVKKRGSRDWTKWVTDTLNMGRTTAYDLMREYVQHYGHTIAEHDETDQPNAKADEIKNAVVEAKEKRKGRTRAAVPLVVNRQVRVPFPQIYATRDERSLFMEAKEKDEERVCRIFRTAFYDVIGITVPEAATEINDSSAALPANGDGQEATDDQASD
jgi:hypothetical protein